MGSRIERLHVRDIVVCVNTSCRKTYWAIGLIPTISRAEKLGRLYCPYCGQSKSVDKEFLWIGVRQV